MAQTGYTPISIYYSSTAAATPTAGNLVAGELAINTSDGKLFYKDSAGVVQVIGTKGGVGSSTTTQVLYNSSGLVVGSANLTFDGTNLTIANTATIGASTAKVIINKLSDDASYGAITLNGTTSSTGSTGIYGRSTGGDAGALYSTGAKQFFQINGATAMTIDASSNVGIGTSSPNASYRLDIAGNSGLRVSGGTVGSVAIRSAATYSNFVSFNESGVADRGVIGFAGGNSGMQFRVNGAYDITTGTEAMRIDSSGNVGIGTTTPNTASGRTVFTVSDATSAGGGGGEIDINVGATNALRILTDGSYNTEFRNPQNAPLLFSTNNTERMRIASDGNLCVGTSSLGNYKLQVVGDFYNQYGILTKTTNNGTGGQPLTFVNSAGNQMGAVVVTGTTSVNYATSSDARLKENIVDAPSAIDKVKEIKVRSFDWIEDKNHVDYGFIAQELYDLVPDAICKGDDAETITNPKATWQVDFGKLTPILVKAIQELNAKVEAQALEIATLKGK